MGHRSPIFLLTAISLLACIQNASAIVQFSNPSGSGRVGLVANNDRSSLDIIWSCLATIFTCVWVAQHPDVIVGDDPRMPKGFTLTHYKLCQMFAIVIGPECLVQNALSDWCAARRLTSNMQAKGCSHWKMKHSFLVLMKGLSYTLQNSDEPMTLTVNNVEDLDPQSLDKLVAGSLDEEINDKDKGDVFAKFVVCIQITYTILKAIARAAQHLPMSELEVTTFGYILCALCASFLWWHKPRNLRRPIVIKLQDRDMRIPGFPNSHDEIPTIVALTTFGTIVGAVHLIAWDFSFPTTTELWLWRSCSLVVALLPLSILITYYLGALVPYDINIIGPRVIIALSGVLYMSARLILFGQSFACFRSLPQGVYAAVWADYAIHL